MIDGRILGFSTATLGNAEKHKIQYGKCSGVTLTHITIEEAKVFGSRLDFAVGVLSCSDAGLIRKTEFIEYNLIVRFLTVTDH